MAWRLSTARPRRQVRQHALKNALKKAAKLFQEFSAALQ